MTIHREQSFDRFAVRAATAGLVALVALGCGGDEAANKRVPSMLGGTTADERDGSNSAPEVEGISLRPARPTPGRTVRATASVVDPDGDATDIRFVWQTSDGRVLGEGRSLDTAGLEEGDRLEVVAVASDGLEESDPVTKSFRLGMASVEIARVAIDQSEGTRPGVVLEAVVEATDESTGGYDVLLEWEVNDQVVGTDDELDTASFEAGDQITLVARFEFEDRVSRPVRSQPVLLMYGEAPSITSTPKAILAAGVFNYQVRATSPVEDAEISFEVREGPEGLRVDPNSGLVQWEPTEDQRGTFEIEVAAVDQWGASVSQRFELTLDDAPAPPAKAR